MAISRLDILQGISLDRYSSTGHSSVSLPMRVYRDSIYLMVKRLRLNNSMEIKISVQLYKYRTIKYGSS